MLSDLYCHACGVRLPDLRVRQRTPFCNALCQIDHRNGKRSEPVATTQVSVAKKVRAKASPSDVATSLSKPGKQRKVPKFFVHDPNGCTGHVYLLFNEATRRYKIGITGVSTAKRKFQIECMSGMELHLVDFWEVGEVARTTEIYLHNKFAEYRRIGEWFEVPDTMCEEDIRSQVERYINGAE